MQLEGRNVQRKRGTWEEISKLLKKAEHFRKVSHEREYGELERTGQPLCIYEPYYGEGTWPFLHNSSLYRGLGLVSSHHLVLRLLSLHVHATL